MNWRRYAPGIIWTAFIAVLCSMPGSSLPKVGWLEHLSFDKVVHFFLFAVWAACFLWALEYYKKPESKLKHFVITFIAAAGYGALLEAVQYALVNERSAEWADWIADCLGTAPGIWLWWKISPRFTKFKAS